MKQSYNIKKTKISDLDFCCQLFIQAIIYQEENGFQMWRDDDRSGQMKDIKFGRHFKIEISSEIATIFRIWLSDHLLWNELEKSDAIYVHGVITHRKFKGQRMFGAVIDWSKEYAKNHGRRKIRLDTWADNSNLIDYYKTYGFKVIRKFKIPDTEEAFLNCRGNEVVLMELSF